ncbi:hypothetical protein [Kineococcus halophytocola]|uniref:hypothetical protein n=1 Tax=Kineococcus halophytocola TaxID=3234027 RepID=UPI00351A04E9
MLAGVAACTSDQEAGVPDNRVDEAVGLATSAATAARAAAGAAGETPAVLGTVGGQAVVGQGASVPLTANSTVRAFAVCVGGGDVDLDLAGTARTLTCDGQVQEVPELPVPGTGDSKVEPSRVDGSASAWAVAFAPA